MSAIWVICLRKLNLRITKVLLRYTNIDITDDEVAMLVPVPRNKYQDYTGKLQ